MNLKAYVAEINMTMKDFAFIIECHPKYLSMISKGKALPSKELARKIEVLTGGKVRVQASTKIPKYKQREIEPLKPEEASGACLVAAYSD